MGQKQRGIARYRTHVIFMTTCMAAACTMNLRMTSKKQMEMSSLTTLALLQKCPH